jgi:hypothetical protein
VEPLDPLTRAAFALHRRPGSYVALLGAGISKPTGVASAWQILEDLARSAAAAQGEHPSDVIAWWSHRFGKLPTYSDVLETLGSNQIERRALLEPYFRRGEEGVETQERTPSLAHRELARLVARGSIRVILTLNFDHLMEEALRAEGVEPTIVVGSRGIEEMEPLHAQRAAVVHLHGEYLSPDLLNTPDELGSYSTATERLLRQVSGEYGLLLVGWSAEWDKRLVELLTPGAELRHATWWIEPGELNPVQAELARSRQADEIRLTADQAMVRLAAAVEAVEAEERKSRPLDIAVGVASIKRELRHRGSFGIEAHDVVREAFGRLSDLRAHQLQLIQARDRSESLLSTSESVLDALRPAATFAAVLAYWGNGETDRWWLQDLEELAHRPHVGGPTDLIYLARCPAMVIAYAAGAAAVAAERWDLVFRLISELQAEDHRGSRRQRLLEVLTPGSSGLVGGSERLCRFTISLLRRHLGLGVATATNSWERFEYLCSLTNIEGDVLPWTPCMRAEGIGASEDRASPAVWLDGHLDIIQPYITGRVWSDGSHVTAQRSRFDGAFGRFVKASDFGLLPRGGGLLPSNRRYPGRFDDAPPDFD